MGVSDFRGLARGIGWLTAVALLLGARGSLTWGGDGAARIPVASVLVGTSGPVEDRQSTFCLWRHQYAASEAERGEASRLASSTPGRLLEVWETQPDVRGEGALRWRGAFPWPGLQERTTSRSEAVAWNEVLGQAWVFLCITRGPKSELGTDSSAEVLAARVPLDVTLSTEGKVGEARPVQEAKWPTVLEPDGRYVVPRPSTHRGEMRFRSMNVSSSKDGFLIQLHSATDVWIRFRPRNDSDTWSVVEFTGE